jgi:peptide/nickel transport system substrate-binding protein
MRRRRRPDGNDGMTRPRDFALAITLACALLLGALAGPAAAQTKSEGEMRWALYVTLSPVWFDPTEVSGQLTPFWVLYAIHDALVKPMPGNLMSPAWPNRGRSAPISASTSSSCARVSSFTTVIPSPPRT